MAEPKHGKARTARSAATSKTTTRKAAPGRSPAGRVPRTPAQGGDPATLRIEYYRSAIGRSWRQKAIIQGLGLRKLRQVVVRPDNPGIRGMVDKVPHLVRILPAEGHPATKPANA